jgi:hypothetical protein
VLFLAAVLAGDGRRDLRIDVGESRGAAVEHKPSLSG